MDVMKAKAKPKATTRGAPERKAAGPALGTAWRMSDLPLHLQVELRDRIEQAKRSEGLHDFDEAIADADRMSDEMLSIVASNPHRPAE